jgi:hypothetical protein
MEPRDRQAQSPPRVASIVMMREQGCSSRDQCVRVRGTDARIVLPTATADAGKTYFQAAPVALSAVRMRTFSTTDQARDYVYTMVMAQNTPTSIQTTRKMRDVHAEVTSCVAFATPLSSLQAGFRDAQLHELHSVQPHLQPSTRFCMPTQRRSALYPRGSQSILLHTHGRLECLRAVPSLDAAHNCLIETGKMPPSTR